MPTYQAPVQDTMFILREVLNIERFNNLAGFEDATPEMIEAILGEAAKLCEQQLQPLNQSGDLEGCTRHDDGSVTTPKGFKQAYKAFVDGGWMGLAANTEFGGQGLPYTLHSAVGEYLTGANMAFAMYPGLTQGAIAAIDVHASPELKQTYLPKMIEGRWTGTMNLTEPHCGTDLGLLRTKASRARMAAIKFQARKSSSRPANMILQKTSFIWCSPALKARRKAPRVSRFSSFPSSS